MLDMSNPSQALIDAAEAVQAATEALQAARAQRHAAIIAAAKDGMPEAAIARVGTVNRMTVRAVLGK